MCNFENDYNNLRAILNAIKDEHKRQVMCNVLNLLATIDNDTFLDCIEVFVTTLATDEK